MQEVHLQNMFKRRAELGAEHMKLAKNVVYVDNLGVFVL